jgi:hypothetical protein
MSKQDTIFLNKEFAFLMKLPKLFFKKFMRTVSTSKFPIDRYQIPVQLHNPFLILLHYDFGLRVWTV